MTNTRRAALSDAAAIAHVHIQSWRTTYAGIVPDSYLLQLDESERTASWREWLALDVDVFVAEVEGKIVGFAGGGQIREPIQGFDAELFAIYLLAEYQRSGIGTTLLATLAAALHARGFNAMVALVLQDNTSSRFYESSGARPIAIKKTEVGGLELPVVTYGWSEISQIVSSTSRHS